MKSRWLSSSINEYTNEFKADGDWTDAFKLQCENEIRMEKLQSSIFCKRNFIGRRRPEILHNTKSTTVKSKNFVSNIECSVPFYINLDVKFQFNLDPDAQKFHWGFRITVCTRPRMNLCVHFQKDWCEQPVCPTRSLICSKNQTFCQNISCLSWHVFLDPRPESDLTNGDPSTHPDKYYRRYARSPNRTCPSIWKRDYKRCTQVLWDFSGECSDNSPSLKHVDVYLFVYSITCTYYPQSLNWDPKYRPDEKL